MAWTSPATWAAGAVLTAAQLNQQIRDNLKAIGDPWTAFAVNWTGNTTNPVRGNLVDTSTYSQAGKMVNFRIHLTMGTTTTYGTGSFQLDLPVPATAGRWEFAGTIRDTSASAAYPVVLDIASGTTGTVRILPTTAGNPLTNVSGTSPYTWASTDVISIAGTYEAA